jgi:tetratricopeptide (TPR) repeat protein
MKYTNKIFALLIVVLFGSVACHRTNKNALSEAFHDLTAHYNSEWNSNDRLRIVMNNIEKNPNDNYDSILNIHEFENLNTTKTYAGDYELMIKKSTFSIQQHESSKWTDNNFYLMGMAHFMKGDYTLAANHFQYITSELKEGYKDEFINKSKLKKKKKKEKEKVTKIKAKIKKQKKKGKKVDDISTRPHEKALDFKPSRNPALVMLALSYVKNEEFDKANSVISYIEADPKFPDNYLADFYLTKSTFYIEQAKYENAVSPLLLGLKEIKKKRQKARPTFVLAQIYKELNQPEEAIKQYENVLKLHPDYNMEFNSKLNIAIITADGNGSSKKAKDILSKMSRDGKNAEMLDQIYYHLGKIAYKDNNKIDAIANFKKSLVKNKANTNQKGLSYVALANVYYDDEEYKLAKIYYDSSLLVLNKNAINYNQVKDRNEKLTRLVAQLDIIDTEDSLQALADLSETDRKKKLRDIINAMLKAREKDNRTKVEGSASVNRTDVNDLGSSSFYFNNTTARNRGYNNFKKLWGDVKLTDNWRRQDKSNSDIANSSGDPEDADNASASSDYRDELKKLQDALPITSEQRTMSNNKKVDAYFLLANIYKDDFDQKQKSIETFELLLSKYPENKYEVECYYNLYLLYANTNSTKSEQYRMAILNKFPTSIIAQAIKDPEFLKNQKSKEQIVEETYTDAYNLYTSGSYELSYTKCKDALIKFKGDKLEPKFAYLSVLNIGKQRKFEEFKMGLDNIIKTYPTNAVKEEAEKMLLYMSNMSDYLKQDSTINYTKNEAIRIKKEKEDKEIADRQKATRDSLKAIAKAETKKEDAKDPKKDAINKAQRIQDSINVFKIDSTRNDSVLVYKAKYEMPDGMDLSKFKKEANVIHRIIIVPANVELASTEFNTKIKAFNSTKPIYKKYIVGNLLLSATSKLITIKDFANEADAMAYYEEFMKSDAMKTTKAGDYRVIVTTAKNQSVAVGNGLLDNLYWFFKNNYLK